MRTPTIEVSVLPSKGADIYSFIDRRTGIDVLFKSPWGWRDPATVPMNSDSQANWLARYAGGWQILIPNAGPERIQDGVMLGYHGEAAIRSWQVLEAGPIHVRLAVALRSAPLRIERNIAVRGDGLQVRDVVQNISDRPVQVNWVHHPAFGAPFIDGRCRIHTPAKTFLTDADHPGTGVIPDVLTAYPQLRTETDVQDLGVVPGETANRAVFGVLADFPRNAWFAIISPSHGFGVRLDWETDTFPYAWFWQECHATQTFPWFGQAYVVAIEPANVLPGSGTAGFPPRGAGPVLRGGQEISAQLTLTRFDLDSSVLGKH